MFVSDLRSSDVAWEILSGTVVQDRVTVATTMSAGSNEKVYIKVVIFDGTGQSSVEQSSQRCPSWTLSGIEGILANMYTGGNGGPENTGVKVDVESRSSKRI